MFAEAGQTIVSFPALGLGPWELDKYVVEDLFGFLSIAWYGLIICVGMLLGCGVVLYNAVKREKLNFDSFLDYFIFCIPIGVIGARVMYVLAELEEYDTFLEMIAIWNGGIAIYGAVIAGGITVYLVARFKKQNPLLIYDAMVPGLLLAQAIGRWGNFVNGEAYGEKTDLPWGMLLDKTPTTVHPTFLYESLITFTGFLIAFFLIYRIKKHHGTVFCFYLVWYGVGRTLVEGLRMDSLWAGSFRISQCIGLLSALGGIALFVILNLRAAKASEEKVVLEAVGGEEDVSQEEKSDDEKEPCEEEKKDEEK
jgi:phosphatidylglycerol:prolipoprotein diacylglycerol transferase